MASWWQFSKRSLATGATQNSEIFIAEGENMLLGKTCSKFLKKATSLFMVTYYRFLLRFFSCKILEFKFFFQVYPSHMSSLSSVKISAPHIASVRLASVWKIAYIWVFLIFWNFLRGFLTLVFDILWKKEKFQGNFILKQR